MKLSSKMGPVMQVMADTITETKRHRNQERKLQISCPAQSTKTKLDKGAGATDKTSATDTFTLVIGCTVESTIKVNW